MDFDKLTYELRRLSKQARKNGDEETAKELFELASDLEKNGIQ